MNIHFFDKDSVLSTSKRTKITYLNKTFSSVDQAYQYTKAIYFNDRKTAKEILRNRCHKYNKTLGNKIENFNNIEWNNVKVDYMRDIICVRFSQDEFFTQELVNNKDKIFVCNNSKDSFWGNGINNQGENVLGKIYNELLSRL